MHIAASDSDREETIDFFLYFFIYKNIYIFWFQFPEIKKYANLKKNEKISYDLFAIWIWCWNMQISQTNLLTGLLEAGETTICRVGIFIIFSSCPDPDFRSESQESRPSGSQTHFPIRLGYKNISLKKGNKNVIPKLQ